MANKLGMTEEQMIHEIEFMREWEKYVAKTLGKEHYELICQGYAKKKSAELLKAFGATDEEIDEISKKVDEDMGWSTEIQ